MEGEGDWVPWGCHRTQWDRNREEKSEWSTKLARTEKYERYQKILGPCKLLQEIYQGLCLSSKTNEYTDKKGY